jgi:hypothetical protein
MDPYSKKLEERRPFLVETPLAAQLADGTFRPFTVPAEGVIVQADPEYRRDRGYVRFTWGSAWLLADLGTFRSATRDLLRRTPVKTS